jgi:RNA polymerase sigma factor (TIGR02999 family)
VTADPSERTRATSLLLAAEPAGDPSLVDLVPLIYDELRDLAHRQLARAGAGATLQTTELVHEAYLRLVDDTKVTRLGRAYFFGAAAGAMRRILVDRARRRTAAKRGGGPALSILDADPESLAVDAFADELIDLDAALTDLAALDARQARVVECRYFGGMSVEETAAALGVSSRTVKYDWALARAWLHNALRSRAQE